MQKILLNIASGFISNGFINKRNALLKINKILNENNEIAINNLDFYKFFRYDYENHLHSINELRNYFLKKYNSTILVENKINNTLGNFLPSQKLMAKKWTEKNKYKNLLLLSLLSYYIKEDKNIVWEYKSKYGKLKISINNSKPEKSQQQIAFEKKNKRQSPNNSKNKKEPKCDLCVENINYKGSIEKDSRENLRVIFINLISKSKWFFQYSPYAYLKEHFVLNNFKHKPMEISNNTVRELLDFIDKNNNYFLGSNSDLEIVGGSILSHSHYQGGSEELPIMRAKKIKTFIFQEAKIDVLNWPLNAIRISHLNKTEIANISNYFINNWKIFNDGKLKSINNSVTIIVNKNNNFFNVYLIFRNNSTSEEKPFGNYHTNPSKFNIKQENIGLIETAGLAILPKRLSNEIKKIIELMESKGLENIFNDENLKKHHSWISGLIKDKIEITEENLFKSISNIFTSCLEDCKVLKKNDFIKFIENKIIFNHQIYEIKNNNNMKIELLPKGLTIKQIAIYEEKLLLEFKNLDDYFNNNDIFLNSFVGPIAGRIQNGYIKLKSKELHLKTDKHKNYTHGMTEKWSDLFYDIEIKSSEKFNIITGKSFQYNKELECTYDINIIIKIFNDVNLINFTYLISCNEETICNPTQHLYWKLPFNEDIFDLNINFKTKVIWKLNKNYNPTKKIKWNSFDFINLKKIKEIISEEQYFLVGYGIDHPIELLEKSKLILTSPKSNIKIIMKSSLNNLVLYTHNSKSKNELLNAKKRLIKLYV
mgnify:CR=1 FL=1